MLGRALVKPGEIGKGRDRFPIFLVTAHGPVGEAEGEGGIGISARSLDREARLGNLRVSLLLGFVVIVVNLARGPRGRFDEEGEVEERIVRRLERGAIAGVKFFPESEILQLSCR